MVLRQRREARGYLVYGRWERKSLPETGMKGQGRQEIMYTWKMGKQELTEGQKRKVRVIVFAHGI
jgi:hypothetical protein